MVGPVRGPNPDGHPVPHIPKGEHELMIGHGEQSRSVKVRIKGGPTKDMAGAVGFNRRPCPTAIEPERGTSFQRG